jgi:hypothetical protein
MSSAADTEGGGSGMERGAHLMTWNDRLSAFVDEALTDDESREVLAHLEVCEVCRARVQAYLNLRGLVTTVPRRFAPRIPYLKRGERPRVAWRPGPAVWAFSGALAVLLLLVVTRPLFIAQKEGMEARVSEVADLATSESARVEQMRMPESVSEADAVSESLPAEKEIPEEPRQVGARPEETAPILERSRGEDRAAPRAMPTKPKEPRPVGDRDEGAVAQDQAKPQALEARAEAKSEEREPRRDLVRVTLILPPEARADKPEDAMQGGGGGFGSGAPLPAPPANAAAAMVAPARTPESISFVLPDKEWKELASFLRKHYTVMIAEGAPGELRVELLEPPPAPEAAPEEENKDEPPKSKKRKQPLP